MRTRNVAICSRVTMPFGQNCVAEQPAVMPLAYAQLMSFANLLPAMSVNGAAAEAAGGFSEAAVIARAVTTNAVLRTARSLAKVISFQRCSALRRG